jgi:hypothetical protein
MVGAIGPVGQVSRKLYAEVNVILARADWTHRTKRYFIIAIQIQFPGETGKIIKLEGPLGEKGTKDK